MNGQLLSWDHENYIFPKVTKMRPSMISVHSRAHFCAICTFSQPTDANKLFSRVSVTHFCEGMILKNNKNENKISLHGAWDLDVLPHDSQSCFQHGDKIETK